jgi:hypothetical protein
LTIQEFAFIQSLIFGSVLSARRPIARSPMSGSPAISTVRMTKAQGVPPRLALACDVGPDGGHGDQVGRHQQVEEEPENPSFTARRASARWSLPIHFGGWVSFARASTRSRSASQLVS